MREEASGLWYDVGPTDRPTARFCFSHARQLWRRESGKQRKRRRRNGGREVADARPPSGRGARERGYGKTRSGAKNGLSFVPENILT